MCGPIGRGLDFRLCLDYIKCKIFPYPRLHQNEIKFFSRVIVFVQKELESFCGLPWSCPHLSTGHMCWKTRLLAVNYSKGEGGGGGE